MRDPLLQILAVAIEQSPKAEIPITLGVNGQLLSGWLCTERDFMDAANLSLTKGTGEVSLLPHDLDATAGESKRDVGAARFIHLRGAQYFGTARAVPTPANPDCIRVDLEAVTSFFRAKLVAPEKAPESPK